jgi:hypothetical protein
MTARRKSLSDDDGDDEQMTVLPAAQQRSSPPCSIDDLWEHEIDRLLLCGAASGSASAAAGDNDGDDAACTVDDLLELEAARWQPRSAASGRGAAAAASSGTTGLLGRAWSAAGSFFGALLSGKRRNRPGESSDDDDYVPPPPRAEKDKKDLTRSVYTTAADDVKPGLIERFGRPDKDGPSKKGRAELRASFLTRAGQYAGTVAVVRAVAEALAQRYKRKHIFTTKGHHTQEYKSFYNAFYTHKIFGTEPVDFARKFCERADPPAEAPAAEQSPLQKAIAAVRETSEFASLSVASKRIFGELFNAPSKLQPARVLLHDPARCVAFLRWVEPALRRAAQRARDLGIECAQAAMNKNLRKHCDKLFDLTRQLRALAALQSVAAPASVLAAVKKDVLDMHKLMRTGGAAGVNAHIVEQLNPQGATVNGQPTASFVPTMAGADALAQVLTLPMGFAQYGSPRIALAMCCLLRAQIEERKHRPTKKDQQSLAELRAAYMLWIIIVIICIGIIIIILIWCCESWRIYILIFIVNFVAFAEEELPLRPSALPEDIRDMMRLDEMGKVLDSLGAKPLPSASSHTAKCGTPALYINLHANIHHDVHGTKQSQTADGRLPAFQCLSRYAQLAMADTKKQCELNSCVTCGVPLVKPDGTKNPHAFSAGRREVRAGHVPTNTSPQCWGCNSAQHTCSMMTWAAAKVLWEKRKSATAAEEAARRFRIVCSGSMLQIVERAAAQAQQD